MSFNDAYPNLSKKFELILAKLILQPDADCTQAAALLIEQQKYAMR